MRNPRFMIGVYMLVAAALADQASKWLLLERMGDVQRMIEVTSFFNLVLVWNKGVTFGMFNSATQHDMPYVLAAGAGLVLILLGRWLARTTTTSVALALGAIMGGAIGNVIDRMRYGAVTDFLDFHYRGYHWYAFNIADAAIVCGVALLLVDGMVKGK